jgi:hypothetical protein
MHTDHERPREDASADSSAEDPDQLQPNQSREGSLQRKVAFSREIRGLLAERYPNHLMPSGDFAAIARELGTSRQHVRQQAIRAGYIVLAAPVRRNAAAERIRDALKERFPTHEIPRGGLQELATELGVTRQHVRHVAIAAGYISVPRGDAGGNS